MNNLQGYKSATRVSGFRLVDSRASYGIGLETFALGFPVHFDWSYRTLLNKGWEDYIMGSSSAFREGQVRGVDRIRFLNLRTENWNL